MNFSLAKAFSVKHEANKPKPYDDVTGLPLLPGTVVKGKVSIGIGRNLTDEGLSQEEIDFLYANDVKDHISDLDARLPWWSNLDDVRQRVIFDMCFNLGIGDLLAFRKMLTALQFQKFNQAADEMTASAWYGEVGGRAVELVQMMRTGKDVTA